MYQFAVTGSRKITTEKEAELIGYFTRSLGPYKEEFESLGGYALFKTDEWEYDFGIDRALGDYGSFQQKLWQWREENFKEDFPDV